MTSSAWCWMSSFPSVAIAITPGAMRANLLDVRDELVIDVDVGRDDDHRGCQSSSSAIGPCFISPAEYASVGM